MSITDELREYADRLSDEAARKSEHGFSPVAMKLEGIADHIDAEHERAMADAELAAAPTEAQLEEWGYVELPKDADGVPIHVGDTVWGCISGMQMAVHELRLTDRWTISTDMGFIPKASAVTHVRLDSFERIADELDEQAGSLTKDGYTWQEDAIHDFADRIRKLAAKEGEQCQ